MRAVIRLAFAVSATLVIALALSRLPEHERAISERNEFAAVVPGQVIRFSDANLVDMIARLPLTQDIGKVNWHHSILVMDLHKKSSLDEQTVYGDLLTLCRFAFEHTNNIEEVLVRIEDSSTGKLLLSLDMTREAWFQDSAALRGGKFGSKVETLDRHVVKMYERSH